MIKTEQLTRNYGNYRGIFDLTMEIPPGKIFGFIGPNGAGKTTTIKLLCGLYRPTAGQAFINGIPVDRRHRREIKRAIGYMPDHMGSYDQMSVWEYLDFFCAAYRVPKRQRKARVDEVLDLTAAAYMLDYQVDSLSQGMGKRVALAKTLLHDPPVLILDEPASGLDPRARIEMRETIMRLRALGKTILLSSHILPELSSVCDLVGIVEKGRLRAFGTVRDMLARMREHIVLRVRVAEGGDADRAADCCRGQPHVKEALVAGDEVCINYVGPRTDIPGLNRYLVEQGVPVASFMEDEGDLEDAFLHVTREVDATEGTPPKSPAS